MSPLNVTNLLVKLVSQNNSNFNRNVNSQISQNSSAQSNLSQNANVLPQNNSVNQNINLNNNINNVLNREFINRQMMNNVQNSNIYTPSNNNVSQNTFTQQNNVLPNLSNQVIIQPGVNGQNNFVQQQLNPVSQNVSNFSNLGQLNQFTQISQLAQSTQNSSVSFLKNNELSGILHSNSNNLLKNVGLNDVSKKITLLNEKNQNINYVKDLMKLPQEMKEVLAVLQQVSTNQGKTQGGSGLLLLSNINIKNLTQLIQNGSKEALAQIMTTSAVQNLTKAELKQLQDAVNYLSVSSSQESQTQALKNFMLLYLPWLPLEEGMDFELDFSFSESSDEDDENILNIAIMTKNFGEIHILIILKAISAFEIYIQCCKDFPKHRLLKLVEDDEHKYSLNTNVVFEERSMFEPKSKAKEAKITLSHVKEISPFLLLIANSLIKYTLLIDSHFSE